MYLWWSSVAGRAIFSQLRALGIFVRLSASVVIDSKVKIMNVKEYPFFIPEKDHFFVKIYFWESIKLEHKKIGCGSSGSATLIGVTWEENLKFIYI